MNDKIICPHCQDQSHPSVIDWIELPSKIKTFETQCRYCKGRFLIYVCIKFQTERINKS